MLPCILHMLQENGYGLHDLQLWDTVGRIIFKDIKFRGYSKFRG